MSHLCQIMGVRILLIAALLSALRLQAQLGGTTVFNSLNIYGSARVAAMGGNYLAIKDGDINVVAANPSLLDSAVNGKLAMSYVDYYAGSNFGYASYGNSLRNRKWTTGHTLQFLSHGTMDETDGLGNVLGEFSAAEYILTNSIAYQYDSLWSLGASVKAIYSNLADYYSLGLATDLAATFHQPRRKLAASLVWRNLGYQLITFSEDNRESLPGELQFGFTKQLKHAPFRFSLVLENLQKWNLRFDNPNAPVVTDPVTGEVIEDNTWEFGDNLMRHVIVGTEVILSRNFNVRIGYNYRRRQELKLPDRPATAGFSYGFGMRVRRFSIDYGRAIFHAAGPANHFTVSTSFGQY
jgi:hypothetical protein